MSQKIGLTNQQIEESRRKFGVNLLTPPKEKAWWILYLEKFSDPLIIILLVATVISLIAGILHGDFIESVGIICAVLIATGVGFWQEYSAKKKFDLMKSDKDFELVKVRRGSMVVEITKDMVVVGDVVIISAGDEIPADIELFDSTEMKVSEASMTGESMAVSKYPIEYKFEGSGFAPNMLLRGTTVEQGFGEGTVVAVGDSTEIGKTTRQASEQTNNKTPLEVQLNGLAEVISRIAFIVAGLMFITLNIVHWSNNAFAWNLDTLLVEVGFLMSAVAVIIVAVPEGLPLSVTLALAFSMKNMAKENNLVKKMHACETIGAVNIIFTDKTGTLTQNSMSVVEIDVKEENRELFDIIGALNSTANWSSGSLPIGNPTDSAILKFVARQKSEQLRSLFQTIETIPFSSLYKYMVKSIRNSEDGSELLIIKGAPEVISKLIGDSSFLDKVAVEQERGRRAIAAAIINNCSFSNLKERLESEKTIEDARYVGSWFIEDPIRGDVSEAIVKCYGAGVDVVMMTGDNIKTGSEIARQAGFKDIWAIEAKDFVEAIENRTKTEGGRAIPNVIARCTPTNKLDILKWAQSKGYVCAMTGDGVNDSPSLNYADVGIAMGSGTSVAKEAADIVLLNDAFPSIVTGLKWGRSLYKNIKNFLFFQLNINVSACLTAVFGPLLGVEMPFTVIQFLWINLVMDSLAAIALASEPADEKVLEDKPRDKSEFIINRDLQKAIFGFGGFVWVLCSVVLWGMSSGVELFSGVTLTTFFAAYMTLNWWNLFNARVTGKNHSVFDGLTKNAKFLAVAFGILFCTILIVQIGGELFNTTPLSWHTWGKIILYTSPVVIVREIYFQVCRRKK
ncbi:MAG: calcium-translocating P-type ATPase, PMCA-type [Rikenellaceae bacterium]